MAESDEGVARRGANQGALYEKNDPAFVQRAAGYGAIHNTPEIQVRVHITAEWLRPRNVRGSKGDG